ncbi:MAG: acyltransferase [Synergistaceae bacterium]|nr:acyltransferase [Synergistaceae bacterium]
MGLIGKARKILGMSITKFIWYNFMAGNVSRGKGCWLIPMRGTRIDLAKSAKIRLNGTITFGINKRRGSKAECLVLLRDNANLTVSGPVNLYYGTTLEVHKGGDLTIGSLNANTGSVIICAKKMTIGQRVRMARNVFVFDSDHHPIYSVEGKLINDARDVVIEDDCWLGLKSTVLKGTTIHAGTVIGANSLVSGEIPGGVIVSTIPARPVMKVEYHGPECR